MGWWLKLWLRLRDWDFDFGIETETQILWNWDWDWGWRKGRDCEWDWSWDWDWDYETEQILNCGGWGVHLVLITTWVGSQWISLQDDLSNLVNEGGGRSSQEDLSYLVTHRRRTLGLPRPKKVPNENYILALKTPCTFSLILHRFTPVAKHDLFTTLLHLKY